MYTEDRRYKDSGIAAINQFKQTILMCARHHGRFLPAAFTGDCRVHWHKLSTKQLEQLTELQLSMFTSVFDVLDSNVKNMVQRKVGADSSMPM